MIRVPENLTVEVFQRAITIEPPARIAIPGWADWGRLMNDTGIDEFAASPRDGDPIAEMTIDTDAPILLHLSPRCGLVDVTAIRDKRRTYILSTKGAAWAKSTN